MSRRLTRRIAPVYEIALTVASCLRAGTRADVAWLVGAEGLDVSDWSEAVVFTPGGGRVGSLLGGSVDAQLADHAGRLARGRLIETEVGVVDALVSGIDPGAMVRCLLIPADQFPDVTWELATTAKPMCVVCTMNGDEVQQIAVYSSDTIGVSPRTAREAFAGPAGSTLGEDLIVSVFRAIPQMVLVGDHPVIDSLAALGELAGWSTRRASVVSQVTGIIATLSSLDMIVVAAHDLELAGTALMSALESDAGYIGALGSHRMQEARTEWLAYRGVTDLDRVHGPAGLDIGAETPAEIAVSILAQVIAESAHQHSQSMG